MLPTIDFTQQLAQLQSQLQSMTPTQTFINQQFNKENCAYRLPCGLCQKTNSFCGMQTTEITNEVKVDE